MSIGKTTIDFPHPRGMFEQATTTTDIWMRYAASGILYAQRYGNVEKEAYIQAQIDAKVALGADWAASAAKFNAGGGGGTEVFYDPFPLADLSKWPNSRNLASKTLDAGSIRVQTNGVGDTKAATAAIACTPNSLITLTFDGTAATDAVYAREVWVGTTLFGSNLLDRDIETANWIDSHTFQLLNGAATEIYLSIGSVDSINAQTAWTEIKVTETPYVIPTALDLQQPNTMDDWLSHHEIGAASFVTGQTISPNQFMEVTLGYGSGVGWRLDLEVGETYEVSVYGGLRTTTNASHTHALRAGFYNAGVASGEYYNVAFTGAQWRGQTITSTFVATQADSMVSIHGNGVGTQLREFTDLRVTKL